MKFMLKNDHQHFIETTASVRNLYERYAGMLLGYILEVVKDRKLAEEYMVKFFSEISLTFDPDDWNGHNHWCKLQKLARYKIALYTEKPKNVELYMYNDTIHSAKDDFFAQLTDKQRQVFYAIYYCRKPVAEISTDLNITEDLTRKTLKEAFAIMKQSGKY